MSSRKSLYQKRKKDNSAYSSCFNVVGYQSYVFFSFVLYSEYTITEKIAFFIRSNKDKNVLQCFPLASPWSLK